MVRSPLLPKEADHRNGQVIQACLFLLPSAEAHFFVETKPINTLALPHMQSVDGHHQ